MASISAFPVAFPFSRRNSSAAITTTSSRQCTVTCCGPSVRTLRTNSLHEAHRNTTNPADRPHDRRKSLGSVIPVQDRIHIDANHGIQPAAVVIRIFQTSKDSSSVVRNSCRRSS